MYSSLRRQIWRPQWDILVRLQHPDVQRTIDDTLARIQDAGRVAGSLANNDNVAKYAAAGVRFLFTSVGGWIAAGAAEFVSRAEEGK